MNTDSTPRCIRCGKPNATETGIVRFEGAGRHVLKYCRKCADLLSREALIDD